MKERLKKKEEEHKRVRIGNEDREALQREMFDNVIQIEHPDKYREKIKGFKEAWGQMDMKERLAGLLKESEI